MYDDMDQVERVKGESRNRAMSTSSYYDTVAASYDSQRRPAGVEFVINYLTLATGKDIKDLHILDAGCGSGQYSEELLKKGFGKITMIDSSKKMVERAKEKVATFIKDGRVPEVKHHKLPTIPYEDATFDVVMFNQLVHLLDRNDDDVISFPNVEKAIKEAYRVLRTGGILLIDCESQVQIKNHSCWYYSLVPEATKRLAKKTPSISVLRKFLSKAGFTYMQSMVLLDELYFTKEHYENLEGPLDTQWRKGNSFFATLEPREIESIKDQIQDMKEKGNLDEFFEECEDRRHESGQATKLFGVKASLFTLFPQ